METKQDEGRAPRPDGWTAADWHRAEARACVAALGDRRHGLNVEPLRRKD